MHRDSRQSWVETAGFLCLGLSLKVVCLGHHSKLYKRIVFTLFTGHIYISGAGITRAVVMHLSGNILVLVMALVTNGTVLLASLARTQRGTQYVLVC